MRNSSMMEEEIVSPDARYKLRDPSFIARYATELDGPSPPQESFGAVAMESLRNAGDSITHAYLEATGVWATRQATHAFERGEFTLARCYLELAISTLDEGRRRADEGIGPLRMPPPNVES